MTQPQQITVLGATGSIGLSTLDVIARHPERYQAFALTGYSRMAELEQLCVRHRPQFAVVADEVSAWRLQAALNAAGLSTQVLVGEDALCEVASRPQVDAVMAAIVGAAGLKPTLAAVRAGEVYLAPAQPFGWLDGPPSINRLLGLDWLQALYQPAERGLLLQRVSDFHQLFYGQALSPAQLRGLLGDFPGVWS